MDCPVVESLESARVLGRAAQKVCGYRHLWSDLAIDDAWHNNNFQARLENFWADIFTPEQREAIVAEFVKTRLG
jgi:hypothetical protein